MFKFSKESAISLIFISYYLFQRLQRIMITCMDKVSCWMNIDIDNSMEIL